MLRRYERYHAGSKLHLLFGLRSKFNESLNAAVAEIGQKMMTITSCNTRDHFDFWGNLSVRGKLDYWQEMDELLDLFDQCKIKLLPTPKNPNSQAAKGFKKSPKSSVDNRDHGGFTKNY